ncbi:MAG TPA: ATP-binding cassette domain-containing protein [Thermoplasmata archaeon]|nr:ATP-binding cassette domain-containing protein [Thermoplasmata archaeon]
MTKRFNGLTAVDDFTLSVAEGETFGLLGPNGAGKTTVIKMLATLLPPTSGSATVAGFDIVHRATDVRRSIGYVPQLLSADGSVTGYENLLVFARLYDIPSGEIKARVRDSLDMMGLTDAADRLVRTYSGGMVRRLEIAQSMIHRPRLLFLDEPTVGLDPLAREAVWDHIRTLRDEYRTTILVTTHYMDEAEKLCNRVAVMHLGKMAALGTPAQLEAGVARETGAEHVTLDEVFSHYSGGVMDSGGTFRDAARTRRLARRLG